MAATLQAPPSYLRRLPEAMRTEEGCRCFERCLVLESDLAHCRQIQEDIVSLAELYEFCDRDQHAIYISLEEALTNAVVHGNAADPAKKVCIDYTVNLDEVRVRIADEGPGFDPSAVPDPTLPENRERPCGRGLMLMRYYMSDIEYNEQGNCIQMCKRKISHPCGS